MARPLPHPPSFLNGTAIKKKKCFLFQHFQPPTSTGWEYFLSLPLLYICKQHWNVLFVNEWMIDLMSAVLYVNHDLMTMNIKPLSQRWGKCRYTLSMVLVHLEINTTHFGLFFLLLFFLLSHPINLKITVSNYKIVGH